MDRIIARMKKSTDGPRRDKTPVRRLERLDAAKHIDYAALEDLSESAFRSPSLEDLSIRTCKSLGVSGPEDLAVDRIIAVMKKSTDGPRRDKTPVRRLERLDAAKPVDYGALSVLRSPALEELSQIFKSLGISGPKDFAIFLDEWEACKKLSSDGIIRSKSYELDNQKVEAQDLSEAGPGGVGASNLTDPEIAELMMLSESSLNKTDLIDTWTRVRKRWSRMTTGSSSSNKRPNPLDRIKHLFHGEIVVRLLNLRYVDANEMYEVFRKLFKLPGVSSVFVDVSKNIIVTGTVDPLTVRKELKQHRPLLVISRPMRNDESDEEGGSEKLDGELLSPMRNDESDEEGGTEKLDGGHLSPMRNDESDEEGVSEKLDGELLSMEEAYSDEMLSKPWTGTPSASSKSGDSDLGNDMAIVASKITTTALNNDWDSLHEFLSNHLPPLTISGCSAKDVIDFLRMQHTSGVEAAEAFVGYLSATCEAHGIRPMNSSQPDEVQKWKAAMADIASIGGYEWQKGKQVLLPEEVVRDACLRLYLKNSKNLTRILAFLNHSQPSDVEIVGLWGMAGIGKTSIAREIFGILAPEYELHYFLQDFYLMCQKKGLRQMRDDFFSKVFREEKLSISACNIKPSFMRNLFRNKKILLVLDDVSDARDVEAVVGGFGWFSQGHRIILTSRRKQVLVQCKVTELYEIQKLCKFESFLLCKQYLNEESGVIMELMNWSSGIPLALKILGFSVSKQHINNMKEHLQSLRRNPPSQIQEVFRRSFDGLDENEKNIFLDLACFFRGEDKDHAVQLLDACGFLTYLGICDLIDQSLISLLDNKIEIPIPFQDIGRFIVHEEDEDPCERSRLWDSSDIADVLTNNSGTEAIEGIFLDVSDLTCELSPTVFGKMYNLRLLKLYCSTSGNECKLNLPQGLDTLPDELRLLHWENYPLEYLPREFNPENLVEINMPYSNMKTLWEGKKNLEKLKNIKLSHSRQLTDILMLSEALNLEQIDLEGCTSLIDVSISIPHLGKLVSLNMKDCCRLQSLPSMVDLTSLKRLNLSGCSELEDIQDFAPNLEEIYLAGTSIGELPLSIENLTELVTLDLENCTRLQQLPIRICSLKSIVEVKLSGCTSLQSFPKL